MTRYISTAALAATTSILLTTTAIADVTAEQVLDDLKTYMEASGSPLTIASQSTDGTTTTLSGVVATSDFPEEGAGSVTVDYGDITLTEENGNVTIGFADSISYVITSQPHSDDFNAVVTVGMPGLTVVASGDDTTTTYATDAPEVTATLDKLTVEGEPLNVVAEASSLNNSGSYTVERGEIMTLGFTGVAGATNFRFSADVPQEEVAINGEFSFEGLSASGSFAAPADFDLKSFEQDPEAFPNFLAAGGGLEIDYLLGATSFNVSGNADGDHFAARGAWSDAGIKLLLNATRLLLTETAHNFDITVSGSEIPFPEINVKMAEYGLNFDIPLEKSDTPNDFAASMRLVGLSVSDFLWGMVDPTGQLPRDPATLVVDLSGTANAVVDVLNPMEAAMHDGPPAELHTATLNELLLSVAGVNLNGSGAFTFDNSDLQSFDGMPRPEGTLDLALTGANTLLDKLVAMGLIPEDQAMGGRMMMGLFAVPGDGEDSLTSTIEVNDQGHVLANGQRLK